MEFYTEFKFSNHFCIPEKTNPCDFPLDKALNYKQACDTAEQAIKAFLKKKKSSLIETSVIWFLQVILKTVSWWT